MLDIKISLITFNQPTLMLFSRVACSYGKRLVQKSSSVNTRAPQAAVPDAVARAKDCGGAASSHQPQGSGGTMSSGTSIVLNIKNTSFLKIDSKDLNLN